MKKDYWAILGLKPGASEKEIRSAYKRLARKHHPDMNPNNKQAEEKFKEIGEAHEVLTDPKKRQIWEMSGSEHDFFGTQGRGPGGGPRTYRWEASGADGAGGFNVEGDFSSILNDLFSGRGRGGGPRGGGFAGRGSDLQYEAEISFEEAVNGSTLRIPLARTVTCEVCGGTGRVRSGSSRRTTTCTRCGGTGLIRSSEDIQARIPPGAEDGSRVRLQGKGEAGEGGGPPGDLFIQLRVRPHRYFRREGNDILLDVPLTFAEAGLGTRLEVPTLAGKVELTIPPGTSSGQRLRLKGRGVQSISGNGRGDQIVVVQIVAPPPDPAARRSLEDLAKLAQPDPRASLGW